jgi:hypothetical protein
VGPEHNAPPYPLSPPTASGAVLAMCGGSERKPPPRRPRSRHFLSVTRSPYAPLSMLRKPWRPRGPECGTLVGPRRLGFGRQCREWARHGDAWEGRHGDAWVAFWVHGLELLGSALPRAATVRQDRAMTERESVCVRSFGASVGQVRQRCAHAAPRLPLARHDALPGAMGCRSGADAWRVLTRRGWPVREGSRRARGW